MTLRPFLEWTSLGDAMDPLMPITTLQDNRLIVNSTKEINNYRYAAAPPPSPTPCFRVGAM